MKYFSVDTVVNAYMGFQNCMTNKSWGYLALLKGCNRSIQPYASYEVDMNVVSNFLEDIFNLSQAKKSYNGVRPLYVVFSKKWEDYFNQEGSSTPNVYDIIVWAYRKRTFSDDITMEWLVKTFAEEFNIPMNIITNNFNTEDRKIDFESTKYTELQLKNALQKNGVDVRTNNIDAKKNGVVASPGEISRGPFVQPLYTGLDITDYVLILQSSYTILYNKEEKKVSNDGGNKHQQIFYGAPGTGKSHRIKNDKNVKEANKKNLVFRTTFHPDSDYSTFVGAYKPMIDKRAVRNVAGDIVKNGNEEVYEDSITYSYVPQSFLQAYVAAWNNPDDKVFLVIEEINRGNCAQIFGDLFQLLDRDEKGFSEYPILADIDLNKFLLNGKDEYKKDILTNKDGIKDGKLRLPSNLYIWATMNTSDQSLFPIDSAFKRRWDWVYMPIDTKKESWFIKVGEKRYSWTDFLEKVNNDILTDETAEDKHLGFYFCKAENKEIAQETFVGKVLFYLWNDVFKVYGIPSQIGSSKEWAYTKFYHSDGSVDQDKVAELMEKLGVEVVETIDSDEEDDLTIQSDNQSRSLLVELDGKIIQENRSIDTFAKVVEMIGADRIEPLGLSVGKAKHKLLSINKLPENTDGGYGLNLRQIDKYWMLTKYNNNMKVKYLETIAESLNINLKARLV